MNAQPRSASSRRRARWFSRCSTFAVKSNVTEGSSACSARATATAWPGPFRKSGSPNVMCGAPASTCWRMSASTTSRGTAKKRPPETGGIGQGRRRWLHTAGGAANRDAGPPRLDRLADGPAHPAPRHDEEAPAVDGRDRAVAAQMLAAAARLDVARELEPSVLVNVGVFLQRRQPGAARHGEVEPLEDRAGDRGQAPLLGTTLARGLPPVPRIVTRALELPCEVD